MRRTQIGWLAGLLAVLAMTGAAQAQQRIGGGGGGSSGVSGGGFAGGSGGFAGNTGSGGGFTGTSGGGFTGQGGFSGSGGFTGQGGFSGTGGFSGQTGQGGMTGFGRTGTGGVPVGQSSFMGRFFGNPLAAGLATGSGSGVGGAGTGSGSQLIRPFPVPLVFGQPLYDQATVSRTQQLGTTAGTGLGGLGTGLGMGSTLGTGRALGGNSIGIRRAPQYLTQISPMINETGPARAVPVSTTPAVVASELQAVIAGSTRLASRDNISVTTTGDGVVVLRGQVRDERERRLAEALLRLSPGVREVRNELTRAPR